MKRIVIAAALFVLSASWFVGCERGSSPGANPPPNTGQPAPPPEKKDTDVHVRTPGVNVDVEHRGEGNNKKVDVNVQRNR